MNKAEKLLAARKKLKEFQMHKSNHEQDSSSNPSDHNHHIKADESQQNNNVTPIHKNFNNKDETNNEDTNKEQSQINSDFNISNNTTNMNNSESDKLYIYSNDRKTKMANEKNEINYDTEENFYTIPTNNEKSELDHLHLENNFKHDETLKKTLEEIATNSNDLIHDPQSSEIRENADSVENQFSDNMIIIDASHKEELKPDKSQSKIWEEMNSDSINVIDNSQVSEKRNIENGVDFFNNINITPDSSDTLTVNTYSIHNNNTETITNVKYPESGIKNESSPTDLEIEKNTFQQFQNKITDYHNKVSELENLLTQKNSEYNDLIIHQLNPLKEELRSHRLNTEVLVAEKTDLSTALSQYQKIAQQKSDEVCELEGKLNNTLIRMTEVENELNIVKANFEENKKLNEKIMNDYAMKEQQYNELKTIREEQNLDSCELRQELNITKNELKNLQQEMEENKNLLSLAELKIQLLTTLPQQLEEIENQQESQTLLKENLSQAQENIKLLETQNTELLTHHNNYIKHLEEKYNTATEELKSANKKIDELTEREESLIQRLSNMEQHYQCEKQKVESLLPLQTYKENMNHLTKSMDALVLEQENLQRLLSEKDNEIELMKQELQELRQLRDQSVETSKLVTALESEQLGASRAVSQNQQLKLQLDEMHDAFVMLSNSKLNLTEQLQDERSVGRKLNAECSRLEAERDELKKELSRKSEVLEELQKNNLHFAQMADQMQHYQVQSNQARTLEEELQNAWSTIETLKKENQLLIEKCNSPNQIVNETNTDNKNSEIHDVEHVENINSAMPNSNEITETFEKQNHITENNSHDIYVENQKKLELRFKETMERVAELTDEKQRLEHLVLQLQGETETIGEYITLYQKQRAILQTKAREKEHAFSQLLDERNKYQMQLHQLKIFITKLLKIDSQVDISTSDQPIPPNIIENNEHPPTDTQEVTDIIKEKSEHSIVSSIRNETMSKILDVLAEIKDCKDTCSVEPNLHHCLWCSGELITV